MNPAHLGLALALTTACTYYVPREPVYRPAAGSLHQNEATSLRYFPPPLALAQPEDAIVRLVGPETTCSGTLIGEDLVLTAHHCVVKLGPHATFTSELADPKAMLVELGPDYLPWGNIGVKAIVAPECGQGGGGGDIAIIVLTRKLIGITPYTVRQETSPRIGEMLDPAGFGRCASSPDGIHREVREGGPVESVETDTVSMHASICPGDSGGPVFARGSHEVVGVVSLSAMDGDKTTKSRSVMARVDSLKMLFFEASQIADGASKAELPPVSCSR